MATNTFTVELNESDRRLISRLCNAIEGHRPQAESDSTACSPAGCGQLEQVTAGRSPDRESFPELLSKIEYEFELYLHGVPEAGVSKAAVTYIKDKVLQHLHGWNRA